MVDSHTILTYLHLLTCNNVSSLLVPYTIVDSVACPLDSPFVPFWIGLWNKDEKQHFNYSKSVHFFELINSLRLFCFAFIC